MTTDAVRQPSQPASTYADARVTYAVGTLLEADAAATPLAQFERWYADAAGLPEPNAMVLATVDDDGLPATRTVLLKAADSRGFVFYTNLTSRKAGHLLGRPRAALTFPWHPLQRQVGVRGSVEQVPREETETYFRSRPYGSRIGAWASHQSRVVPDRTAIEQRYEELVARWPDTGSPSDVPVPDFWGGLVLRPQEVEFWQGRPSRLHDRLVYVAVTSGGLDDASAWRLERREP